MITVYLFRTIGGFGDKEGVREFLFALPRFATDKVNSVATTHLHCSVHHCMDYFDNWYLNIVPL